jgi:hypothetical protein
MQKQGCSKREDVLLRVVVRQEVVRVSTLDAETTTGKTLIK